MKQLSLFITQRCNLKCRLCSGHIPYVNQPQDVALDTLKAIVDTYFRCVDCVEKIVVSGGETFLYRELTPFLDYLYQYRKRFKKLELFTNGTIIPDEECIRALARYRKSDENSTELIVFIDDYGLSLSKKRDQVAEILKENKIDFNLREYNEKQAHCGGWVDFGDLRTVIWKTEEEKEKLKKECAFLNQLKGCFGTSNGVIYPCTPARIQAEFKFADNTCGFDLLDTSLSDKEKSEMLKDMQNKDWYSVCSYCEGMRKDSRRFVPAVQLTEEEVRVVKMGARSYQEVLEKIN